MLNINLEVIYNNKSFIGFIHKLNEKSYTYIPYKIIWGQMIKNLYLNIPQSTLYRIRISLCTQSSIEPRSLASHFKTERSIYRIVYLFLRLGLLLSLICHHFSCSFQFLSSELLKVFFKNCCDLVPPCLCICPFNDIIVTAAT